MVLLHSDLLVVLVMEAILRVKVLVLMLGLGACGVRTCRSWTRLAA